MTDKAIAKILNRKFAKLSAALKGKDLYELLGCEKESFLVDGRVAAERERADDLLLVLDGMLAETEKDNGTVRFLAPGSLAGYELILGSKNRCRARGLYAVLPTLVLRIPLARLERYATGATADAFLRDMLALGNELADEMALRAKILLGHDGAARIARLLKHFKWSDPPPVRWKDIAGYLCMNLSALSRTVHRRRNAQ